MGRAGEQQVNTAPHQDQRDSALRDDVLRDLDRQDNDRRGELAAALAELRTRIADAAAAAGRNAEDITLVAVTKTFPASDGALLADLGLVDFGENRDQEAAPKIADFARLRPQARVNWHMIGRLQRNKARSVAGWADVVQSVDSQRLADALSKAAVAALADGRRSQPMEVLIQANLDAATHRGGCPVAELPALAEYVATLDGLTLRGVMAIAPLDADPDQAFERLATAAERLRAAYPQASVLSAGMTGDLECAIRHGSTCVRVGTALLGDRRLTSP